MNGWKVRKTTENIDDGAASPLTCNLSHAHADGIYTIRFYKYGQWKNVVIDDRCTTLVLYARVASRATVTYWSIVYYARANQYS
jgi:hypothetical protein